MASNRKLIKQPQQCRSNSEKRSSDKVSITAETEVLYRELLDKARQAMRHSYSPLSGFSVGAAILTEDGAVYTGCNIENAIVGGSICAERTTFVKAVSEGKLKFKIVAIVAAKAKDCWPCGVCRQYMREFGGDIVVVVESADGSLRTHTLDELLPHAVVTGSK